MMLMLCLAVEVVVVVVLLVLFGGGGHGFAVFFVVFGKVLSWCLRWLMMARLHRVRNM